MFSSYNHVLTFLTLFYFSYVGVIGGIYFNHCLIGAETSYFRPDSGIVYPEPAGSVESVSEIREFLLEVNKSSRVQLVGENDWVKLI